MARHLRHRHPEDERRRRPLRRRGHHADGGDKGLHHPRGLLGVGGGHQGEHRAGEAGRPGGHRQGPSQHPERRPQKRRNGHDDNRWEDRVSTPLEYYLKKFDTTEIFIYPFASLLSIRDH